MIKMSNLDVGMQLCYQIFEIENLNPYTRRIIYDLSKQYKFIALK